MSRLVSFVVLVAVVLLVTALFFRVMLEFLVPMFLAAVLVVVFRPLHKWYQLKFAGHPRVAAGSTTISIVLIVLLPSVAIGWNAYLEVAAFARNVLDVGAPVEEVPEDEGDFDAKLDAVILGVTTPLHERFGFDLPSEAGDPRIEEMRERLKEAATSNLAGPAGAAAVGAQWIFVNLIRLVIGLVIMVISIYYFLADGPAMIVTVMHLSPLDDRYELELFEKFTNVSRAVVVATLLSAFVQGVLAGIGYYFAGIPAVFALTGLTMLLAVVPFLGAAAVWLPTSVWLLLAEERTGAAIALAIYGLTIVSAIDNVIKPYVLHGQSNLHPLLALLSVLGGVAALGPIGILVGPMAVAFLQALLGMLRREIHEIGEDNRAASDRSAVGPTASPHTPDAASASPAEPTSDPPAQEPPREPSRTETQSATRDTRRKATAGKANKRRKSS